MSPDLGLGAQSFDRMVEELDCGIDAEGAIFLRAHREHVDLRLLDLQRGAAGIGELCEFGMNCGRDREHPLVERFVILIVGRDSDNLRGRGAELHRAVGLALRRLPEIRILQLAAIDRPSNTRQDARLGIVRKDRAMQKGSGPARRVRIGQIVAAHVMGQITRPALPADIIVETTIAVGDDIEPGGLLIAQISANRVHILLAEIGGGHRLEETARRRGFLCTSVAAAASR